MWTLIKIIFYTLVLSVFGLLIYAYVGPFLGVEFAPPMESVSVPVDLDLE